MCRAIRASASATLISSFIDTMTCNKVAAWRQGAVKGNHGGMSDL
jgi:hypothetical protein